MSNPYSVAFSILGKLGPSFFKAFVSTGKCFEELKKDVSSIQKEFNELSSAFNQQKASADKDGNSIEELGMKLSALQKKLTQAKSAMYDQRMLETKAGLIGGLGFLGDTYGKVIEATANFESVMTTVKGVSGAVGDQYMALENQARQLGESTEWSASQVGEGMKFLAMSGMKVNDITKAMPGMLNLATVGELDLARAADITSNILNGFGKEADYAEKMVNILANAATNSNVNIENLGEAMSYVAPVAKNAGASIELTTAMIGKLGDAGIQGSRAGTTLSHIFTSIASSGQKTIKQLGVAVKDGSGKMRDYGEILADLGKKFETMGNDQKVATAKAIFGAQAYAGALSLMEDAAKGKLGNLEIELNKQGTAAKLASDKMQTLAGRQKEFASALEGLQITLGKQGGGLFGAFIDQCTGAVQVMNDVAKECPELGAAFGALGGIASLYSKYGFEFNNAIQTGQYLAAFASKTYLKLANSEKLAAFFTTVWTSVQKVATVVTGGMSAAMTFLNTVIMANPIGALIVALMALVAVGVLVYKNWNTVSENLRNFYEATFLPVVNGLKQFLGGLMDFVGGVFCGEWAKAWIGVRNIFAGVFNMLVGIAKTPLNLIISMINGVITGINAVAGSIPGIDVKIPLIPFLAKGGIATGPTLAMIGEGSEPEAVVPLSKLENMIGGGTGGMNVTFSPTITITGGGDAYDQVKRGLAEGQDSFRRQLEQLMANQRRLSYA